MRYWAYLAAKLGAAGLVAWLLNAAIDRFYPQPPVSFLYSEQLDPFTHDLGYTFVIMIYWLVCMGLLSLVIWDQRYRCRVCLRWLRMPIATGSWNNMLIFGKPQIEYICPYGHGTLKVPEVQITGPDTPDWKANQDIWKELESIEEPRK